MFQVDHCFRIGHDHKVCQDYATSGKYVHDGVEYVYGIVADGCSSSPNVDVGARFITLAAQTVLELPGIMTKSLVCIATDILQELSKYPCIDRLVQNCSMDSTLVLFIADDKNYRVIFCGDGSCHIEDNGSREAYTVSYSQNTPPYLGYILDSERHVGYNEQLGETNTSIIRWDINDPNISKIISDCNYTIKANAYHEIKGEVEQLNEISIFSDGISSFTHTLRRSMIDTNEMIRKYTEYPIRNGVFVQRNFNYSDKQNTKQSIVHSDDLSCASMIRRVKWEK